MNIHEYQAKTVLKEFGVPVPRGKAVVSAEEAEAAAKELGGPVWVVKSQIHAGGRGKGRFKGTDAGDKGGVRLAKSVEEVKSNARQMLGRTLVTIQTGAAGKQVSRLYIEEGSDIASEFYLSALVDRETSRVAFVVSTEGGMDIEKVAHDTPEKILTFSVDPATGIMPHHGRTVAKALGLSGDLAKRAASLLGKLYRAFTEKDMSMLEVNPLVITKDDKLVCLDAKIAFDSNALYRHPEIMALRDESEEDEKEIEASKYDLNYIALDGSIGCMVNGAGELPRRRRRRFEGKGDGGVQDHHRRPEGPRHSGQHLRRHHEVRRDRGRRRRCGQGGRPRGAARRAARRHERRAGQEDHQRVGAERRLRERP